MLKKIEKLKEVKALIDEYIKNAETKLFVESPNGNGHSNKTIKEPDLKVVIETKR